MMKNIVTPIFAVVVFAAFSSAVYAQSVSQPCFPTYEQFCKKTYSNSCLGQNIFNDKMVRPFDHCMSTSICLPSGGCCGIWGGCGNRCGLGGCFDRLLGRNVPCAGPDFGYTYTPGYGANGQGFAPNWRSGHAAYGPQGGMPTYIYRSPRDFLNPNPPSIGY